MLAAIETRIAADRVTLEIALAPEDGAGLAWLYENGEVLRRKEGRTGRVTIALRVGPERVERIVQRFPKAKTL